MCENSCSVVSEVISLEPDASFMERSIKQHKLQIFAPLVIK